MVFLFYFIHFNAEIWRCLKLFGTHLKFISVIKVSTEESRCKSKFGHKNSEEFKTIGLMQENTPLPSNVVLEVSRKV